MAGPSGFVDRYKGKLTVAQGGFAIAGITVNTSGYDANTSVGWGLPLTLNSTVGTIDMSATGSSAYFAISSPLTSTGGTITTPASPFPAGGMVTLAPISSQQIILTLPKPTPGCQRVISFSTINSSTLGIFVKVSASGAVTLSGVGSTGSGAAIVGSGGSTLSFVMKSTLSCQIALLGLSTTQWLFESVAPSTIGHLVFSTTT